MSKSNKNKLICVILRPGKKIAGKKVGALILGEYRLRLGENWLPEEIKNNPRYQKYIGEGLLEEKATNRWISEPEEDDY